MLPKVRLALRPSISLRASFAQVEVKGRVRVPDASQDPWRLGTYSASRHGCQLALAERETGSDTSELNALVPAKAGISGNLGRDLRHEIPGQARDERCRWLWVSGRR